MNILPLITVWLQVQVLPCPPEINGLVVLLRCTSESPHQKRLASSFTAMVQYAAN